MTACLRFELKPNGGLEGGIDLPIWKTLDATCCVGGSIILDV